MLSLALALSIFSAIIAVFTFAIAIYTLVIVKTQKGPEKVVVPEYQSFEQARAIYRKPVAKDDDLGMPEVYDPEEDDDGLEYFDRSGI